MTDVAPHEIVKVEPYCGGQRNSSGSELNQSKDIYLMSSIEAAQHSWWQSQC